MKSRGKEGECNAIITVTVVGFLLNFATERYQAKDKEQKLDNRKFGGS